MQAQCAGAPPRNRLTQKQHSALLSIAKSRGWDDRRFREHVRQKFGTTLEFLSRAQASGLIDALTANGHDRQPGGEG